MFIGRKEELRTLTQELADWQKRSSILIYGKRRVGKSTMINQAAKSFSGTVINHLCVSSTFEGNLELLCKTVSQSLSLPFIRFNSLFDLMEFLGTQDKRILLIIDEYPYWKQSGKQNEVDSYMQTVIDRLPSNVKLILCGSYVSIMKELLTEGNPLFGRFSLIQHICDFDYYDAAKFYPRLPVRDKIAYYAIFGGSPFVLENLNTSASLKDNIIRLLLPETGLVRSHIENVMLKEIQKAYDARILGIIGNGKKRYSEIRSILNEADTGLLDKQLKILLNMETIRKTEPINRKQDKKKQFYEIEDNLMRFYFTFIFGNAGTISRIGAAQYYHINIEEPLQTFVSRRLEGITLQYFHRMAELGNYPDIEDFGSYWYDDPAKKKNGEFDCVMKRNGNYDFYECKFYDRPMTLQECQQEEKQVRSIREIAVSKIGFVCTGGFAFEEDSDYVLIDGEGLFR